jgi:phospholipase/carboxylesterase
MGWAYAELAGLPYDVGHYYLYIPKNRPDGPLPALLFLHGSAGNFKSYMWLWAKLAEEQGLVIIAPSFGFGSWRPPVSMQAVLAAVDDAATVVPLDSTQIYAVGLSNGGIVTSQLGKNFPERFRGLIYLSPVLPPKIVDQEPFLTNWPERPMLIITGAADRRIPLENIKQHVATLEAAGVVLTTKIYPDEDHFLFFSQPENVLNDISIWLLSQRL